MSTAREEMLAKVRAALKHQPAFKEVPPIPESARIAPREPGEMAGELDRFCAEVERLGGKTKRLQGPSWLKDALRELVAAEGVSKATLWQTSGLKEWQVAGVLRALGVELVEPYAPNRKVAECELGITEADFVLPETGTLVLRSNAERPRAVSLLPRVHLAIVRPDALRPDLHQVFDDIGRDGYFVFVTGPSRTSDIELTTTIGVHGPKSLYAWVLLAGL